MLTVTTGQGSCALFANGSLTLTIKDTTVNANGEWGIAGWPDKEKLIIENSTVTAEGTTAAIADFGSGIELIGCSIVEPDIASIDNGAIIDPDGYTMKRAVISPAKQYYVGDVNRDGEVDLMDATLLSRYVAEWDGYADQVDLDLADMDGKDGVTLTDVTILARVVAEWDGYEQYKVLKAVGAEPRHEF